MRTRTVTGVAGGWLLVGGLALSAGVPAAGQAPAELAETRAVAYLAEEVPRWRAEHPCYSCHNNGDATRALAEAFQRGLLDGPALDEAAAWLGNPDRWNDNATRNGSEDLPLARIQFASALASLVAVDRVGPEPLARAAALIADDQQANGSWRVSTVESLGSPAGYGTAVATASARRVLARAGRVDLAPVLARADRWLREARAVNVVDASAVLLGLEDAADTPAAAQRQRVLEVLKAGQAPDGGWGPYVTSRSEPFDTALTVLALDGLRDAGLETAPAYSRAELGEAIARARVYLVGEQLADGSWLETTRPAGQESYAQRISTAGWALLALLESRPD